MRPVDLVQYGYRDRMHCAIRLVGLALNLLVPGALCLACSGLPAIAANFQDIASPSFDSFRCPEDLTSDAAKQTALKEFAGEYATRFPNNTIRDMMSFRYRLLVAHSCVETLNSMFMDVNPLSEMLRIGDSDFGPRTEEFDRKTNVWTVWFRKDGQPPALSDEDLIVNFYGWKPAITPAAVASAFISPRQNLRVLGKFQAPDDMTKAPAYFVVSQTLYAGASYGYVNISKITSVGTGTYTVTLAKKIVGTSSGDVEEKGRAWLLGVEGKAGTGIVRQVRVDPTWEQYFAKARK